MTKKMFYDNIYTLVFELKLYSYLGLTKINYNYCLHEAYVRLELADLESIISPLRPLVDVSNKG